MTNLDRTRLYYGYSKARDAELWQGSIHVKEGEGGKTVTVPRGEGCRMFTDRFTGCLGIAYIALGRNGRRRAYMQHVLPDQVEQVQVPRVSHQVRTGVAVVMAYSVLVGGLRKPSTAAAEALPYDELFMGWALPRIVKDLTEVCGDPESVAIVPYYSGSSEGAYSRTLLLDIQPNESSGVIIAEGKHQFVAR